MSIAMAIFMISSALWLFVSFAVMVYNKVNSGFDRREPGWASVAFIGIPWLLLPVVILISAIFVIIGYI